MSRKAKWLLLVAVATTAIAVRAAAQQAPPAPQIPIHEFRGSEDTWKHGQPPEDIKAGVRPDYTRIREQLVVIPVRGQVHLIAGAGGNIAVQVGDDGVFMVDSGVPQAADNVVAAYKSLTWAPLRWIVNTSVDDDHTGGNEAVGKSGVGGPVGLRDGGGNIPTSGPATIVAFETVLGRMGAPTGEKAARSIEAWPSSTFASLKKKLYFNNEPIEVLHQPNAHSDGDVMVYFRFSDVIAAGDVFNTDRFPYFNLERGGSIQGIIDALNRIVDITVPAFNLQGGTLVVPGHGRIANQADVVDVRDMATIVRDRVKAMVDKRMTLAQVRAAQPLLDYEGSFGSATGPWTTDMFLDALYKDLSGAAPAAGRSTR